MKALHSTIDQRNSIFLGNRLGLGLTSRIVLAIACVFVLPSQLIADDKVDYLTDIKPIFKERCFACHGSLKQEGGLRLDAGKLIREGGDSGPAINFEDTPESYLLHRISSDDDSERMPPEGKPLTEVQVEKIRSWIERGAVTPTDEKPEEDPLEYWSFQPIKRPEAPVLQQSGSVVNPIDTFISSQHEQRGLTANARAPREVLLRRVYLDLIGLPPTRSQLQEFLGDQRPDAWERVVDQLLESPHYGERWGRHWMDVWRYSDWYGRRSVTDATNSYGQIWRWRDWIVRSLNEDRGYDWMVRMMLAADELAPKETEHHVATGYLVRNYYRWNYQSWIKDNIEHTGKAFLGLTFNCCQCHDHKYDPMTQEEYFAFRAFFEPLEIRQDRLPGEKDPGPYEEYVLGKLFPPMKSGFVRVMDKTLDAKTYFYTGGDERNIVKDKPPIPPTLPAFLGGDKVEIASIDLPAKTFYPGLQSFIQQEELAKVQTGLAAAKQKLAVVKQKEKLRQEIRSTEIAKLHSEKEELINSLSKNQNESPTWYSGEQKLRLDASKGRRILENSWNQLESLPDGTKLSFRVHIVRDGKFNLQLAGDFSKGATAGILEFIDGRIEIYPVGSTTPTQIGEYQATKGETQFQVSLILEPHQQQMLVTVISFEDQRLLVDRVPARLAEWNPAENPRQGIYVDAHPNTIAEIDDIQLIDPQGNSLIHFDFETDSYEPGSDVTAIDNWRISRFSSNKSASLVSREQVADPNLQKIQNKLRSLLLEQEITKLKRESASHRIKASEVGLQFLTARAQTDNERYIAKDASWKSSAKKVSELEHQMKVLTAESDYLAARLAVLTARQLPASDKSRDKKLKKAESQLATTHQKFLASKENNNKEPLAYSPLGPLYPKQSTGRRAALANWITSKANPLTARVAANHIWMRHFGQPLVDTPDDFGRRGSSPSHPKLLDWLAAELHENGWQMKGVHRLIVTSETYKMHSAAGTMAPSNKKIDQDNHFLWKFPTRRMEAEAVRDSILFACGSLDMNIGGQEIEQDKGATIFRRSLYFSHHGEKKMLFLELFDAANPTDCYRRTESVVPQQALAMANSELTFQQSQLLAKRLENELQLDNSEATSEEKTVRFIQVVFRQILSRAPSVKELNTSLKFLKQQTWLLKNEQSDDKQKQSPVQRARASFIQALLNHSDFLTIR